MFDGFINALTGSPISANPGGLSGNNSSPGGFRGIIGSLIPFINNGIGLPNSGFNNAGFNPQVTQAYQNSINQSKKALQPGSAIISTSTSNAQLLQQNNGAFIPGNQFAGQNPIPLSGFAGQNGFNNGFNNNGFPGGIGGTAGFGNNIAFGGGGFPQGSNPLGNGPLGKLQILVLPVMGAITLVKSLFQFRKIAKGLQPYKSDFTPQYSQREEAITSYKYDVGSLDSLGPEFEDVNASDTGRLSEL